MNCPLCGHIKAHKHGKMPNGHQRYLCPVCHQTFGCELKKCGVGGKVLPIPVVKR